LSAEHERIVVDSGSDDDTGAIAAAVSENGKNGEKR
jgi:glycosyltransferase involved in cell wall biosynthesis